MQNITASESRHFDEGKYYRFGLALGLANLAQNRLRLGLKKSIGKILQPINSYTRFPEYQFIERKIRLRLQTAGPSERLKLLDVGSPKCLSLYLAFHLNVEVYLTDIDEASIREAEVLWNSIRRRAKGVVSFSIQDVRSLEYTDQEFDVVYSMSVIEHVSGRAGDSESMREMARVLKAGGLLLVTVPIGENYVEQEIVGFEGAARSTGDRRLYFHQRIYTPATAEERIIQSTADVKLSDAVTVSRSDTVIARCYRRLGPNARGMLGFVNPILSTAINRAAKGILAVPSKYGSVYSVSDLYGDLMLAWDKNGSGNEA